MIKYMSGGPLKSATWDDFIPGNAELHPYVTIEQCSAGVPPSITRNPDDGWYDACVKSWNRESIISVLAHVNNVTVDQIELVEGGVPSV